jgi:hypothetical protein
MIFILQTNHNFVHDNLNVKLERYQIFKFECPFRVVFIKDFFHVN